MCTEDALEAEIRTVRRTFIERGFPGQLGDNVMETEKAILRRLALETKPVQMLLPLKDDTLVETARRTVASAMNKTP